MSNPHFGSFGASSQSSQRRGSILEFVERHTIPSEKRAHRNVHDYFHGPRDITSHSKLPHAFRMHGSVTPKIILRTLCVGLWASVVTFLSEKVYTINIHPIITTVLGILVGFSLNLRSSTAYERYMEGRKIWSHLNSVSTSIARNVWIHAEERDGDLGKQDLLSKISFLNLIIAFSVALKHKLRFEPYIQYNDLQDLVSHLDTFAKDAGSPTVQERKTGLLRQLATLLHIAQENPRSEIKRAKRPIGNLPLEILSYMSAYLKHVCDNGTMKMASMESKALNDLKSMDDIIVTSDRILNTPLPIAYTIAISQITWVYVIALPFQLTHLMGWITIPTTTLAAYIILGFAAIGNEIENPFGLEVGDLPLEAYCAQIASDITIISSKPPPKPEEYLTALENRPLYPISSANLRWWPGAATEDIRDALKTRAMLSKPAMWRKQSV